MKYYLLEIWEGVEPNIHGPYANREERDKEGLQKLLDTEDQSGWFRMDVNEDIVEVSVYAFSGREVEDFSAAR